MSKLAELIEKFCPNGVEYKELNEIAHYAKKRINATEINENTYVGVENLLQNKQGKTISSSVPNNGKVIQFEKGDILLGNIRPYLKKIWLSDCAGGTNGDVLAIQINDRTQITPEFLYYVMSSDKFFLYDVQNSKGAKMPRGDKEAVMKYNLPVPPLEVQREIVRVLDSFTFLTAELTAELTARKKQYNFYRDALLKREYKSEKVKLNTVCEIYDGTHQTPQYTNCGIPFVSVENIDDLYGTQKFIAPQAYEKYKIKPRIGDVFMTRITAGIIGKCTVVDRDDDLAYYVSLALLRPNTEVLNSKYLKYYLESSWGRKELNKWILWDATPTKINKDDIGRVLISIPPLDTQKKLVQVIEDFDTICTDLNIGLPAEIEARQKQYEYYRDLLLTFVETGRSEECRVGKECRSRWSPYH